MSPEDVARCLTAEDYARVHASLGEKARAGISEDSLRDTWQQLISDLGSLRHATPDIVLHDISLELERGAAHLQVAYREDEIVGLVLRPGSPTGRFGE